MKRGLVIAAILAVSISLAGDGDPGSPSPVEREDIWTMNAVRALVLTCNAYRADHGTYPGPTEGLVGVDFLRSRVTPVYIRKLPETDAWGNPFRYASDGKRMAIVSFGRDGKADRSYVSFDQPLDDVEGDDIVWSGGHLVACPAALCKLERATAQRKTLLDLKSIGLAVEAYKLDHGVFPETEGYVATAFLRSRVEPVYIRELPLADGWGNTFQYRSDGKSYRIASPGSDGAPDRPYDEVVPGTTTTTVESDLVFGDGKLLQGPEGAAP